MNMKNFSRRAFIQKTVDSLFTLSLVGSLAKAQALTGGVKIIAGQWLIEMEQASKDLRLKRVKPHEWQQQIESLLTRVELSDLLSAVDYERLSKSVPLFNDHESAEDISFSKFDGLPSELSFAPFFYAMKKGAAIVPHGHRNMATMHMVLSGEAHGWHYDRVRDEPHHLIINPTSDKVLVAGGVSTISDEKDNIHWFKALTEPVFMFNIGVYGLNPAQSFTGRDYIDPLRGQKLKDGLIRAERLSHSKAYKLYGKS